MLGSLVGAVRLDFERGVDVPEVLDRDRLIVAVALDAGHIGAEQPDHVIARGVHVSTSSQSAVK